MKVSKDSQTALKTIEDAKSVGLLVGNDTTTDAVAAAMALYHLFSLTGKKVVPVVPGKIPEAARALPSSTAIKKDFGPKNLVVTLHTGQTPIEKVSYRTEEHEFKLVIHPLDRAFAVENVEYSYEGLNFDLLITLGVKKLADLGDLYEKNRNEFSKSVIINLDVSSANENYGQINLTDPTKSSVSELLFHQLLSWELIPSKEVAQCLLTGLSSVAPVIKPVEVPVERKPF